MWLHVCYNREVLLLCTPPLLLFSTRKHWFNVWSWPPKIESTKYQHGWYFTLARESKHSRDALIFSEKVAPKLIINPIIGRGWERERAGLLLASHWVGLGNSHVSLIDFFLKMLIIINVCIVQYESLGLGWGGVGWRGGAKPGTTWEAPQNGIWAM